MADNINGKLYFERMGRSGPVMAFVHPNPMDSSCWLYQMARFSTWFRCIAIDIPGYGRSPTATAEVTRFDIAQALWETLDDQFPGEQAIVVGCSVGANLSRHMYHLRPERTAAIVMSGTGYRPSSYVSGHVEAYRKRGIAYRRDFTFLDFSAHFRASRMAGYFATLFSERDALCDLPSILYQIASPRAPQQDQEFLRSIRCPALIVVGSEDDCHPTAPALQELLPDAEFHTIHGAGHACHMEQPWEFDAQVIAFLRSRNLFPAAAQPAPAAP